MLGMAWVGLRSPWLVGPYVVLSIQVSLPQMGRVVKLWNGPGTIELPDDQYCQRGQQAQARL